MYVCVFESKCINFKFKRFQEKEFIKYFKLLYYTFTCAYLI